MAINHLTLFFRKTYTLRTIVQEIVLTINFMWHVLLTKKEIFLQVRAMNNVYTHYVNKNVNEVTIGILLHVNEI